MMQFPTDGAAEGGPVPSGFNWGAFLLTPLFLLFYGRVGMALFLVGVGLISSLMFGGACLIIIALPVALIVGLYFGIRANEVAWATQRFETHAALKRSMFRWNIAGALAVALLATLVVSNNATSTRSKAAAGKMPGVSSDAASSVTDTHATITTTASTTLRLYHVVLAYRGGMIPPRGGQQAPPVDVALRHAESLAARIHAGADFAAIAAHESDDAQSGKQGGSLGRISLDQLPQEARSAVRDLKPGEISKPVKSQFGVHIFKVGH